MTGPASDNSAHDAGSHAGAWQGTAHAMWPRFLGAVCLVAALVAVIVGIANAGGGVVALLLPCVPIGVAAAAFSRIVVAIDRRGFTVDYGPLPWPRTHIELAEIRSAAVTDVVPLRHGGWGYRGSRLVMKRAAVVIRGGEGIHLQLANNRQFVVTVDNAAQGVVVLNDLLANATDAEVYDE